MKRRPPRATRSDTLFPYAPLFRSRAVKVDGGYRLSGSKQFITSAQIAGIAIVYAVTDPAAGKRGISGFIVPTDAPGYRVDKVEHKLGQNASDTCAIRFDDVFVEENLRLGADGAGRSEERRVGQEWVSTGRSRGSPYH